jgi:uncharacterized protein YyaL (SSP411 family)
MHRAAGPAELAAEFKITEAGAQRIVEAGKVKLFDARLKRIRPHRDDKILTEWNGMMIGSLAAAGAALEEPRYIAAAEKAAGFLRTRLTRPDGRLLRRFCDGEAAVPAFLDDYAFLCDGLTSLYEATFKTEYLDEATRLAEAMVDLFGDSNGGFFLTAKDGESLIARTREIYDGALPSGNAVAIHALLRLAGFTSKTAFKDKAVSSLESFWTEISVRGIGYPHLISGVEAALGTWTEIVIAGDSHEMLRAIRKRHLPNTVVAQVPAKGVSAAIAKRYPFLEARAAQDGKPAAYVCRNAACKLPITSADELAKELDSK